MPLRGDTVLAGIDIWCTCHTDHHLLSLQMFALLLHDACQAIVFCHGRKNWRSMGTHHEWQQQCGQKFSCLLVWKVAALQLLLCGWVPASVIQFINDLQWLAGLLLLVLHLCEVPARVANALHHTMPTFTSAACVMLPQAAQCKSSRTHRSCKWAHTHSHEARAGAYCLLSQVLAGVAGPDFQNHKPYRQPLSPNPSFKPANVITLLGRVSSPRLASPHPSDEGLRQDPVLSGRDTLPPHCLTLHHNFTPCIICRIHWDQGSTCKVTTYFPVVAYMTH